MASTQNDEIDEIQRQMREIRINLGDEVHGLVNKARAMTDWRVHWRKHPWIWGSAAAALGYLIVPSRRFGDSDARTLADIARASSANLAAHSPRRRIISELASLALGIVAKKAMQELGRRFEGVVSRSEKPAAPAPYTNEVPE
ncbi:MAG TPA: hypothetical protein VKU82_11745 [Planctomycetaceae bacterium]|nr:hypothetical protein [Planctomycetaceae bacterium]